MIEYKKVTIARQENVLMSDIDLSVNEREFVYLIGKVGSGKSSLLKTLYKELDIQKAELAHILDYDLQKIKRSQIPYLRRRIGIIFQDFQLLTDRNVKANLDFALRATGWKKEHERENRIQEVLALVDMKGYEGRMPSTLSGGEQQRIVIARALLNSPMLILADEPTGNLDPETGHNIVKLLYSICKEQKTAVIMATHNVGYLDEFPGRVLCVQDKKLLEIGGTNDTDSLEDVIKEVPCTEGLTVETSIALVDDPDDNNNAEGHCSQSANQPEVQCCIEESDQKPFDPELQ